MTKHRPLIVDAGYIKQLPVGHSLVDSACNCSGGEGDENCLLASPVVYQEPEYDFPKFVFEYNSNGHLDVVIEVHTSNLCDR